MNAARANSPSSSLQSPSLWRPFVKAENPAERFGSWSKRSSPRLRPPFLFFPPPLPWLHATGVTDVSERRAVEVALPRDGGEDSCFVHPDIWESDGSCFLDPARRKRRNVPNWRHRPSKKKLDCCETSGERWVNVNTRWMTNCSYCLQLWSRAAQH